MKASPIKYLLTITVGLAVTACQTTLDADFLILNGDVYTGENSIRQDLSVATKGSDIVYVGTDPSHIRARQNLDASGMIVAPGFIDPHTHAREDLNSEESEKRENSAFRLQGVTTVVIGNDGGGDPDISAQASSFAEQGIGTNVGLFVGHGAIRKKVMNRDNRPPTTNELLDMERLIETAMKDGALGLSTGLFYSPGSYSETDEIISLAKIVAQNGGIYHSHIRDESNYNIGVKAAVEEVIEIGRRAEIPVHISHIKALGVDVWGQSNEIIQAINKARNEGIDITADQYPWTASSTSLSSAFVPSQLKAGGEEVYQNRLADPELRSKILSEVKENIRRRGGADAVLLTRSKPEWQNKRLDEIAEEFDMSPEQMVVHIAQNGDSKIASFNMNDADIEAFMTQNWVMTGSDGGSGHPRKFASFPRKYETYVKNKQVLTLTEFLYRSSGLTAQTLNLCDRGLLKPEYKADIVIFDPSAYSPKADYENPERLSEGVTYLLVNGELAVEKGQSLSNLPGTIVNRCWKVERSTQ